MLVCGNERVDLKNVLAELMVVCGAAWLALALPAIAGCTDCGHKSATSVSDPSMDFILELGKAAKTVQDEKSASLKGGATGNLLNGSSNSTSLQVGTQSTLLQTGSESTMLQMGTKSTSLNVGTQSTLIQGNVAHESLPVSVLILLDVSQTMKYGMDGEMFSKLEPKIEVARRVLRETVGVVPPHVKLGLRTFGGGVSHNDDVDCRQSALLVPIGEGNHNSIVRIADAAKPAGVTPLAYALSQAPDDFQDIHGIRRIVLISDGMDTCHDGDPCEFVRRLSMLGYKMKIDVVGVGPKHDASRRGLDCISKISGGKSYEAETAAELAKSLKESLADAVGEGTVSSQIIPKSK
jgi:hypothetical protein